MIAPCFTLLLLAAFDLALGIRGVPEAGTVLPAPPGAEAAEVIALDARRR